MSIAENEDDDGVDIYCNLPNFNYDDSLQKLEKKNKVLFDKVCALEKKVAALTKELLICKTEKLQLAKNISSLYKSAKQEIIRKTKRIDELTARNLSYEKERYLLRNNRRSNKDRIENNETPVTSKIRWSISPSKVSKVHKSEERRSSIHRYHTRSSEKDKNKTSKKNVNISKSKGLKNKSNILETFKNSEVSDHEVVLFKKSGESSGSNITDGSSLREPLVVEENIHVDQTVLNEIQETDKEDIINVKENSASEEFPDKNPSSTIVLPEFIGPRTTFSIRRYKQLYGVSPLKKSSSSSKIKRSLPLHNSVLEKETSHCNSDNSRGRDSLDPNVSGISNLAVNSYNLSIKSSKNIKLEECLELNKTSNSERKDGNKRCNNLKENVVPEETENLSKEPSFRCRKEDSSCISNEISTDENLRNDSTSTVFRGCNITYTSVDLCTENECDSVEKNADTCGIDTVEKNAEIVACKNVLKMNTDDSVEEINLELHDSSDSLDMQISSSVVASGAINNDLVINSKDLNINTLVKNKDKNLVEKESVTENSLLSIDKNVKLIDENNGIPREKNPVAREIIDDKETIDEQKNSENLNLDLGIKDTAQLEIQDKIESKISTVETESGNMEKVILIRNETNLFKKIDDVKESLKISHHVNEKKNENLNDVINSFNENLQSNKESIVDRSSDKIPLSSPNSFDSFTLEITRSDDEGEIDVVGQSDDIDVARQDCKDKINNIGEFSEISCSLQIENSNPQNRVPLKKSQSPKKCTSGLNLSSEESDSSNLGKSDNLSLTKASILSNNNKSLKKLVTIIKPTKKIYENKEQQFKDLFGESPLKFDETSSSCSENIGSNFISFNCNPVLTKKIQNKESNKVTSLLDQQQSNLSNETLKVHRIETLEISNEKSIAIVPDVSKNYLDFKEAFQNGKSQLNKSNNVEVIDENDLKGTISSSKNDSVDKENPGHLGVHQKLSPISSPKLKNILCDKTLKNNIAVPIDKHNESIKKIDENLKMNESELKSDLKFSPDVFGSELNKNSSETSVSKTDDIIRLEENNTLTSCDDSIISSIKRFYKIGDTISPIKTPLKHPNDDLDQNSLVLASNREKSELCSKTKSDVEKISDNNKTDDCRNKIIRNFCELSSFISPLKIPDKLPEKSADGLQMTKFESNSPSDQVTPINSPMSKSLEKSSTESGKQDLTPTVIKKDGISVCLSSEHCEFKRKLQIRKIIKINDEGKHVNKIQREESSVISCNKRKCEDNLSAKEIISEEPDKKKLRILTTCDTVAKLSPKRKEREFGNKFAKNNLRKPVVKNSLLQKKERINDERKTIPDLDVIKGKLNKEEVINKNKPIFLRKETEDRINAKKEDKLKLQKNVSTRTTNRSSCNNQLKDKEKGSILNSSVCERRSPSEYFNRQNKSRIRNDNLDNRRSNSRLARHGTPPHWVHTTKHRNERRLEMALRSATSKYAKLEEDYRIKRGSHVENSHQKFFNERKLCNNEVKSKNMEQSYGSKKFIKNMCFAVKRLSESPNIKEIPSCVKQNEENLLEWKMLPLEINDVSSNLISKFVSHKMIPVFNDNIDKNKNYVNQNNDIYQNKTNPVHNALAVENAIKVSKSNTIIIKNRTRRLGQRQLEDSKGFLTNISPIKNEIKDNKIKLTSTSDDKHSNLVIEQEVLNKKKQPVQKTRCIVKTPLDFKKQFGDTKTSGDDPELSVSSSSESQHSDESWKPKRLRKTRK